ncbi:MULTISPECIES: response regulator transcription factor [unclassified Frankia]|uniref:response regulator transcription factor n=1 Tax=unclassified Frankia TaxID=2632575 RepID=UPI001EF5A5DF|nr:MULTISPECIES: response regulator transcription factor [unclassified Frankia]
MARVLVVDDDATVAEVVDRYLRNAGFDVDRAADGPAALRVAGTAIPDLVVLDLMLPGLDGIEVCRQLRESRPVPVIMLTALGEEADRIAGLECGADDYVTKPFSPRELTLRVQSVLRRANELSPPESGMLRAGTLVVDAAARTATRYGVILGLTVREFDLLVFLLRHPGRAFTRVELMEQVWGWSYGDPSTVTVHIRRLREKIEDNPTAPRMLVTVWGVGYRYDPTPPVPADETPS